MTVEQFEARYVRMVGIRKSLLERSNGDCIFFDSRTRRCGVYSDRPRQCRSWPFWTSNIESPEAWEETCRVCPGSGRGRMVSVEEIERQAAMIRV
jgi:Fe-S-cluster containining protein